jgi:hypothetical protein
MDVDDRSAAVRRRKKRISAVSRRKMWLAKLRWVVVGAMLLHVGVVSGICWSHGPETTGMGSGYATLALSWHCVRVYQPSETYRQVGILKT